MVSRNDAKLKILRLSSMIASFLNDPFRHVSEPSPELIEGFYAFELAYLELVVLLTESQRYGPRAGSERRYGELRATLGASYQDLRPFLMAFLRFDVEDERIGLLYGGKGSDAFEATWAAPSLQEFVTSDDVFFADRIARAQDALKYYNDHLHYLGEAA